MPIDWETIVAPFRVAFQGQTKSITDSMREIGKWLKKRLEDTRLTEQLSRAYPVIDFTEGSVQASVALFQQHSLGLPKETGGPRPEEEYLSGWQRFARGFHRIPDAMEEALAIPRLVGVIEDVLGTIVASIGRWEKPDWHMFDTKLPRSFSDLFGQIFYFAEMMSLSVDPIRVVLNSEVAKLLFAPSKSTATSESDDSLGQVVQYMVAALLLIPIGGMWLASLFRWGIISLKFAVLGFLTGIEDLMYSLRRKTLEFVMGSLVGVLDHAYLFLEGAKLVMLRVLDHVLSFGIDVLQHLLKKLRAVLYSVSHFMIHGVGRLFGHIIGALDGVMNVNVGKIATHGILSATVKDLVDIVTNKDRVKYFALRKLVKKAGDLGDDYDDTLGRIWPKHVKERTDAALEILDVLAKLPRIKIPNVDLPLPASAFPNIYEYFTTLNSVDMAGSLTKFRGTFEKELPAVLDSAGDTLTKLGDEMTASAGNMAWIGPLKDVTRVRDFADSTSAALFGDQEKELREHLKSDALAAAFDMAVADGGFHIVGAAIPLYVESMREFWDQKPAEAKGPLPTSPHILAKHQKLGCVKLPAIKIRTTGRNLDDPLISRVANEFRQAVQNAWAAGLKISEAGA